MAQYNRNIDFVQTANPPLVAGGVLVAIGAIHFAQLHQQNVGQVSWSSYIYPSTLVVLLGTVAYGVAAHYGIYPFKPFDSLSIEEQFFREATGHNVVNAVKIFKDHAGTRAISEDAVNDMLKFLCSSATQEQTQRDTALIIEFLDIAKENNYSLYKQNNYNLKKFDIATQAPDCLELVGVPEKIQELVVEGG